MSKTAIRIVCAVISILLVAAFLVHIIFMEIKYSSRNEIGYDH